MFDPLTASLIAMLVMGVLGVLAGWAVGNWYGYDRGYADGRKTVEPNEWEVNRRFWGLHGNSKVAE